MDTRVERIVLETDRHRIVGDLTLPREGYRSRLSDYLNRGEMGFIPLANARSRRSTSATAGEQRDFIAVARTHIHLAYPAPARLAAQAIRSPSSTSRSGRSRTTPCSSSSAPITRHSEMNGPICFGGKLTTATTRCPRARRARSW